VLLVNRIPSQIRPSCRILIVVPQATPGHGKAGLTVVEMRPAPPPAIPLYSKRDRTKATWRVKQPFELIVPFHREAFHQLLKPPDTPEQHAVTTLLLEFIRPLQLCGAF
jgi:hypothetical protein